MTVGELREALSTYDANAPLVNDNRQAMHLCLIQLASRYPYDRSLPVIIIPEIKEF